MSISAINPALKAIAQQATKLPGSEAQTEDFGKMLTDVMKDVNSAQHNASEMQNAFMTGQNVELHELMISMERAGLAMELTLQVRNKLLDAYQELSRMQV